MVAETVRRFLQHHHQQEQLQHQQHQQLQQQLRLQQQQQYGEQQGQQRLHAPEPPLPNQIHARHAQVLAHAAHARMQAQRARSQAQRAGAQAHGEQAEQSPPQLQIQQVHLPVQTPAGAPSASPSAPISLSSESPRTSTQAGMTVDPRAVQVRTAQMGPVQPQFDHMRLGLPPEFGRPHTEPQSELERRQFIVAQQATLGVANGAVPGPVGLSVLPAQPQQPLTAEHTAPPSPLLAPTPLIHATHGRDLTPGFALAPPPQLQSAERPPTPDLHSTPARSSLPLPPPPPLLAEENDISASRFGTLHGFLSAGPSLLLTIGDNSFNLQPTQLDQHSGFRWVILEGRG
jgi:hypothetical protein